MHFRKLTTFKDHEILDIFDTFGSSAGLAASHLCADRDDSGRIGCDEFFLLLSLLAARESGRATQFLCASVHPARAFSLTSRRHIHSKQLFDTISKNTQQVTFERFARVGFVIGVPEHVRAVLHGARLT